MMDDKILDELLTQWKTERTPRPDEFTSDSDFEAAFLTKAAAVKRPTPRKKTSLLDVLANAIPSLTANRKISVGHAQRQSVPLFAMPKMAMSASIASHACMECCAPSGLAFSRSEVDLGDSAPLFDTEEYKTVGERPFVPVSTNLPRYMTHTRVARYPTTPRSCVIKR